MSHSHRHFNLDVLRSIAIAMVLIHHTVQMLPEASNSQRYWAGAGALGVDLFFVLSGYLIGGLYWREQVSTGKVKAFRFVLRRALRTIPPYFVALALAYLAVWWSRNQPFDWSYLLFLQNYHPTPPYFLVSWSLCVEEHFYLMLPLVLIPCRSQQKAAILLLIFLCLISPTLRLMHVLATGEQSPSFGYATTATHFRLDGLLLGVIGAHPTIQKRLPKMIGQWFPTLLIFLLFGAPTVYALPQPFQYVAGGFLFSVLCTATIIAGAYAQPFARKTLTFAMPLGRAAYSIYLVHALLIHVALKAIVIPLHLSTPFALAAMMIVIGCGSSVFFVCVERPCIRWRDHFVKATSA